MRVADGQDRDAFVEQAPLGAELGLRLRIAVPHQVAQGLVVARAGMVRRIRAQAARLLDAFQGEVIPRAATREVAQLVGVRHDVGEADPRAVRQSMATPLPVEFIGCAPPQSSDAKFWITSSSPPACMSAVLDS